MGLVWTVCDCGVFEAALRAYFSTKSYDKTKKGRKGLYEQVLLISKEKSNIYYFFRNFENGTCVDGLRLRSF